MLALMPIRGDIDDHIVVHLLTKPSLKMMLRVRFDVARAVVLVLRGVAEEIRKQEILDRGRCEQSVVGKSDHRPGHRELVSHANSRAQLRVRLDHVQVIKANAEVNREICGRD